MLEESVCYSDVWQRQESKQDILLSLTFSMLVIVVRFVYNSGKATQTPNLAGHKKNICADSGSESVGTSSPSKTSPPILILMTASFLHHSHGMAPTHGIYFRKPLVLPYHTFTRPVTGSQFGGVDPGGCPSALADMQGPNPLIGVG